MLEKTPTEILSGVKVHDRLQSTGFVENKKLYIVAECDRGTNPVDVVLATLGSDLKLLFEYITMDMPEDVVNSLLLDEVARRMLKK